MSALVALLLAAAPEPGLYSGAMKERHGLLQLEVKADGKAHFRQVVTVHLPPAEIENLDVTLEERDGKLCLSPAPSTIEPCLSRAKDGWVATLKHEHAEVTLVKRN